MDSSQRGRISAHPSRSNSPNPPQQAFSPPNPSQQTFSPQFDGLDPNVNPTTFTSGKFNTAQHLQNPYLSQNQINMSGGSAQMFASDQFGVGQHAYQNTQFSDPNLAQAYNQSQFMPGDTLNPEFVDQEYYMAQQYNVNAASNVNPADLSKISSPDHASPGSGLLSPETHNSPGPQMPSPTTSNGQFHTPQHSRHTSLDPSSAYEMSASNWQGVQFQQHRRLPSDQYSDVSSHSPYLGHTELNESGDPNKSPFLTAQDPNTYGIEAFNITDPATSQPGSTYVSPRLMPSQGLGVEPQVQDVGSGDMYSNQQSYQMGAMHNRQPSAVSDIGQADQYAMPIINIEPAPVSRQASFGPNAEPGSSNALSPPSNSRGRNRSQSDTTGMTRPINSRSASPSARQASDSLSVRSTSPSHSRESSPGVQSGRISKDRDRRASTSSMHSRDYILDLADPQRPNASPNSGSSSRVQKHPATFQCTLCPKKFTRAYNLRSHLRTHTDERPFVCTVCGKAFARQHDRKRHEGLHSGEKKFVCKGELNSQPGQTWGCGRRFARADALGRHFRSEAGRVCIKPLLDEEAAERRAKQMIDHQHMANSQMNPHFYAGAQPGGLQPVPPGMIVPGMADDSNAQAQHFALPAALMAQYPQLANLDWNAISQGNLQADEGDLSDVGGEYYDGDGMDDPSMVAGMGGQGYPAATGWVGPG